MPKHSSLGIRRTNNVSQLCTYVCEQIWFTRKKNFKFGRDKKKCLPSPTLKWSKPSLYASPNNTSIDLNTPACVLQGVI